MRPVRLEMDGFASFRSATTVDFTEADYFALIGPTGSGKSTVLDAIVFALYGTAPRWGRSNAIEYSLAPTATRGTVRLVFDVGSMRYQVAREVRRTGSAGLVQQKGAFLERFLDSTAQWATSEEVHTIAAELREVRSAVEQLIGLTFDDFTQAVVLPQGRFAEFLSATPSARQDILLKLLGADQYDQIRKRAAERQRTAEIRADQVGALLADVADATPQQQDEAEARAAELDALSKDVDQALVTLMGLRDASREAATKRLALAASVEKLTGLRAPEGVADLTRRSNALATALTSARTEEGTASDELDAARDAVEAAGSRTMWERLSYQWEESRTLVEQLPELQSRADSTRAQMEQARGVLNEARQAMQDAHQRTERARQVTTAAAQDLTDAEARRTTLASTRRPTDVHELAARVAHTKAALVAAQEQVGLAERADDAARVAAEAVGDGSAERRDLDRIRQRAGLLDDVRGLEASDDEASRVLSAARSVLDAAEREAVEAARHLEAARDSSLAVALRERLAVGDDCPVCERRIDALPASSNTPPTAEAQAHLTAAHETLKKAQGAHRSAEQEATRIDVRTAAKRESLTALQELIGQAHPAVAVDDLEGHLEQRLATVEAAGREAREASAHLKAARESRGKAQQQVAALTDQVNTAHERFRTARAPFLTWGFHSDESEDLAHAWAALTSWIDGQVEHLDGTELPQLRSRRDEATTALEKAESAAVSANNRFEEAERSATEAARSEATASGEVGRAEARRRELDEALRDSADAEAVTAALGRLTEAEEAASVARKLYDEKRAALLRVAQAQEATRVEFREARQALNAARDALVQLGAPRLDEDNLGLGWETLTTWAADARARVQGQLDEATTAEGVAVTAVTDAEAALVAAASAYGVEVDDAGRVATAVAGVLADARTRLTTVKERIRKRAKLEKQEAEASEEGKVAGLLAESLKANKFQKWLAGAALDMLVVAASDTLHELSGGQYGLTHDKGEFFVIDHEDAEATRSVRTLSGGETFQTSLALALALSDQLSSLSSSAAKLESLFLDEGFGTLDASSLETVALTLERLAQGDRMVGVVTHVPSLAERVPTRFKLTRDSHGSRVVREG